MDIYRMYEDDKRLLSPIRQKFAGQTGDALSTTLRFKYRKNDDGISFLNGKTAWIVFSVKDDNDEHYAYGESTDPVFDGYKFAVPYEVTQAAEESYDNHIEYQLVFTSANVTDNEDEPPTFNGLARESSIPESLVVHKSLKDPLNFGPSLPSQLTSPPTDIEGWIEYLKTYGILTPISYDGRHLVTFHTYNGQPHSIDLNTVLKEDFGVWSDELEYQLNSLVIRDGKLYISLLNENKDKDPALYPMYWSEITSGDGNYMFSTFLGNGTDTVFEVEHDLNSMDFIWALRQNNDGESMYIDARLYAVDMDTVRIEFKTPPIHDGVVLLLSPGFTRLYRFKGVLATIGDLPDEADVGDVYCVKDPVGSLPAYTNYAYWRSKGTEGKGWSPIGTSMDIKKFVDAIEHVIPITMFEGNASTVDMMHFTPNRTYRIHGTVEFSTESKWDFVDTIYLNDTIKPQEYLGKAGVASINSMDFVSYSLDNAKILKGKGMRWHYGNGIMTHVAGTVTFLKVERI